MQSHVVYKSVVFLMGMCKFIILCYFCCAIFCGKNTNNIIVRMVQLYEKAHMVENQNVTWNIMFNMYVHFSFYNEPTRLREKL
jgi:hypothetical protein